MSILDRNVIHAGKIFIKAGEENARAYIIQNGTVRAFLTDENGHKVIVGEYDNGRIIAETCLMVDEPMTMSYEAVTDVTVVTVTRQDFEKRIAKMDKDIYKILTYVMNKLNYQEQNSIDKAKAKAALDEDALKLVDVLTRGLGSEKKFQYEQAILPHMNAMIKELKNLKARDKEIQNIASAMAATS
jgi:CRP/FNR family cyclic AMP-dependent transcriptional regulator